MSPSDWKELTKNNITTDYKKSSIDKLAAANNRAKQIAEALKIDDLVEVHSSADAFITLKDQKENFRTRDITRKPARLINPAKPQIAKVSKIILQGFNRELRFKTKLNQWQSTDEFLDWLETLGDRSDHRFFKYDITSFYPSVRQAL